MFHDKRSKISYTRLSGSRRAVLRSLDGYKEINLNLHLNSDILYFRTLNFACSNFISTYVDRSDFIKFEMKEKYQQGLKGLYTDNDLEVNAFHRWFPRTFFSKHTKYDKKTPGLSKLEDQGDERVGLFSKTYFIRKTKVVKVSMDAQSKGNSKRLQSRIPNTKQYTVHVYPRKKWFPIFTVREKC